MRQHIKIVSANLDNYTSSTTLDHKLLLIDQHRVSHHLKEAYLSTKVECPSSVPRTSCVVVRDLNDSELSDAGVSGGGAASVGTVPGELTL